MSQLSIAGERVSGQEVRTQNVTAALSVANVVKSSLGPVGLDKMLVDDLGEVTITNDGATILDQLEVEHPAAKVLVQLSEMQDKEVGDGTTSVVILAAATCGRRCGGRRSIDNDAKDHETDDRGGGQHSKADAQEE